MGSAVRWMGFLAYDLVAGLCGAALGLGPSETLFSYHSLSERPSLVAIATVLQQDLSSIGKIKPGCVEMGRKVG